MPLYAIATVGLWLLARPYGNPRWKLAASSGLIAAAVALQAAISTRTADDAVRRRLVDAIRAQRFDLVVCNLANPDMVGHTGDLGAAILAAEAVDAAIGAIAGAVRAVHGALLITADHGNLEMMRDPATGQPHTAHTVGPVPLVYVGEREQAPLRDGGALRDVAPTVLDLLRLPVPAAMTGRSLFAGAG